VLEVRDGEPLAVNPNGGAVLELIGGYHAVKPF
jgi:hypothetical protein